MSHAEPTVAAADERSPDDDPHVDVDADRWAALALAVLCAEQATGELNLTFIDRADIAELNAQHMGVDGETDVLSFPLDDELQPGVPVLLGDVVLAPAVAADQYEGHAGTLDDELALLVVHGVLHILGYDHAVPADAARMRARELELLVTHHWRGPPPGGFRQEHADG